MFALLGAFTCAQASQPPCPADASSILCGVIVSTTRTNGQPADFIYPGEPIIVTIRLVYVPFDPITGGRTLSIEGGVMTLSVNGGPDMDITPGSGVPRFGPRECAPSEFFSVDMPYTPLGSGELRFVGEYHGGTTGVPGSAVSGTGVRLVRVVPDGPLFIARESGNIHLWFYGDGPSYEIQGSTNMRDWDLLATVTPVDGRVDYRLPAQGRHFFRFRRL